MAVYRYATKDLSINNAKAFVAAMNAEDGRSEKKSVILYVCIGRTTDWPDEPTPVYPPDNDQYLKYDVHREFIGCKKVSTGSVSHVIPRYNWTTGTVYSMYRDVTVDMYEKVWYVMTDEYNVYICLYNNKDSASTVKPTGFSTIPFTTSDGYTWKYMYTVSLGDASKFMTSVHIPVKTITTGDGSAESDRQLAVQNAAVNGAINIIETLTDGAGYFQVYNAGVASAGTQTLRISVAGAGANASTDDNFYNGSSVYVISGTGAGQLRRIVDYVGSTKTLTVNTAFATVCNTDSKIIISPTVTVVGDGKGTKAYSILDTSTGAIANIAVITAGSGHTRAEAYITANSTHGSGATARPVINPPGGHGRDPIHELHADKIMLNVQLLGSEGVSANGNGYIPSNTEFRTLSVLADPILKVDANNNTMAVESIANTSNSPSTLRMTTRLTVAYKRMEGNDPKPEDVINVNDVITNERNRLRAELGTLEFVTELGPTPRRTASMANAVKAANANVVYIREDETAADPSIYTLYINNVESYGDYPAFTKDDIILRSTSDQEIADVQTIKGPEANTFSGEIVFTENIVVDTRSPEQIEDFKIILDF